MIAAGLVAAVVHSEGGSAHRPLPDSSTEVGGFGVGQAESRATQVWMAARTQAAQRFVDASSQPGSAAFRHFLTPDAYTARFGASATQVKAVESYLEQQGFTHVFASANDDYVSGIAPASDHHSLKIPASLEGDVLAVTGRNDAEVKANLVAARQGTTTKPDGGSGSGPATGAMATAPAAKEGHGSDCIRYWGQKLQPISPPFHGVTSATLPICGYSASDIRDAYGLGSSDTGAGVTIALIQEGGPVAMARTLDMYAKQNGLPDPAAEQYREEAVNGGDSNSDCADIGAGEAELDSQAAYAMAPAARQLMVDGDDCDSNDEYGQALLDAMLAPLTGHGSGPRATIESVSWNLLDRIPGLIRAEHAIALRAAAEGVSLMVASGDELEFFGSAQDPDLTAVGGTALGLGAGGKRLFETGWSTAFGERSGTTGAWINRGVLNGTGGGVSTVYPEPAYQRGVVPDSIARTGTGRAGRAIPDIAADGDFATAMLVGQINPRTGVYSASQGSGGTSQATPLVAGIVADAEQGQHSSFGFLNPLLYSLSTHSSSGTAAITDVLPLNPRTALSTPRASYKSGTTLIKGKYSHGYIIGVTGSATNSARATKPGYDTLTGLGTPNGTSFINALRTAK